MPNHLSLSAALFEAAKKYDQRLALWCRGRSFSYGQLFGVASAIAGSLIDKGLIEPGDRIAILSERTMTAYAGIWAALFAGAAYVPLNPRFPEARNRAMLERSGARALICDEQHRAALGALLKDLSSPPTVVLPESNMAAAVSAVQLLRADLRGSVPLDRFQNTGLEGLAYLLFTSGTTGVPKGVPISNLNVLRYVTSITELSRITVVDRTIQLVDLTFDLSVHDMFMTWLNGAALYSVPEHGALLATRFVEEHEITNWLSVPSTASLIKRAGELIPGSMPSLRNTYFCGEALPASVVEAWAAAAPNSSIRNIYGPTEATVAFSVFDCIAAPSSQEIVPLGLPLPDQHMGLFNPDGTRSNGGIGEICLAGSQVMSGYWQAPEVTASRMFDTEGKRWYRTGDLGRLDPDVGFLYAGRVDRQIKIRGFRVELQEIENVLRRAAGTELAAVVPWPLTPDGAALGCVAFVMGDGDAKAIVGRCSLLLADYMVPSEVIFIDTMPTNSNGKIDYGNLQDKLRHSAE